MAYIHRLDRPRIVIAPHQELKAITFNDGSVQTTASVPIKSVGHGLTLAQDELTTASDIPGIKNLTIQTGGDGVIFADGSKQNKAAVTYAGDSVLNISNLDTLTFGPAMDNGTITFKDGTTQNTAPTTYNGTGVTAISGVNTLTFSDNTTMATAPSVSLGTRTVYTQTASYTATSRTIEPELLRALQWIGSLPFEFEFEFQYTGTPGNHNLTAGSAGVQGSISKLFEAYQRNNDFSGFRIMFEDSQQSHLRLYASTDVAHNATYYTFSNAPTLPQMYDGSKRKFTLKRHGAAQNHKVELYIDDVKMIPQYINGNTNTPVPDTSSGSKELYNDFAFKHGEVFITAAVLHGDANITNHAITNMKLVTTATHIDVYAAEVDGRIPSSVINSKVYGTVYQVGNSGDGLLSGGIFINVKHGGSGALCNWTVDFQYPAGLIDVDNDNSRQHLFAFPRAGYYQVFAAIRILAQSNEHYISIELDSTGTQNNYVQYNAVAQQGFQNRDDQYVVTVVSAPVIQVTAAGTLLRVMARASGGYPRRIEGHAVGNTVAIKPTLVSVHNVD